MTCRWAPLSETLKDQWSDFHACRWPQRWSLADIGEYFTSQNLARLSTANEVAIGFSYFLPDIELMRKSTKHTGEAVTDKTRSIADQLLHERTVQT